MPVRVSCPYCNTSFALPAVPASGRAACVRCGDSFPVRTFTEIEGEVATPQAATPARRTRAFWSARRAVVVAMLMGLVGVGVGVLVYPRGPAKTDGGEPDAPPSVAAVAPAALSGLGFLPADVNVALAVQPGPVLAYAGRTNQEPRALLRAAGVPDGAFAALDRAGVTLPQIDHLAAGAKLGDELRFTLALVLRRPPADEDKFLAAVGAKKARDGKPRFDAEVGGAPVKLVKVSPRAWVFGWDDKDVAPAERGGLPPGGAHLSAGLQEALTQRLPPDAAVWLATDSDRWAERPTVKLLIENGLRKKEWLPLVAKGRAAVIGLSFDAEPRARAFVRTADAETGEQLRNYFKGKTADGVRHGGAGEWALYDAPLDEARKLIEN